MEADLRELVATIQDPHLRALLERVLGDAHRDVGALPPRAGRQALPPGLRARPARALPLGRPGRERDRRDLPGHRPRRRRHRRAAARHRQARGLHGRLRRRSTSPTPAASRARSRSATTASAARSRSSPASRPRPRRRCCTSSSATTARSSTAARSCPCTREATLVHLIDNLGGRLGSLRPAREGARARRSVDGVRPRRRRQRVLRAARRRARAPRGIGRARADRPGDRPDRSSVGASGRSRGCPPPPGALGTGHPGCQGWRSGDPSCVRRRHAGSAPRRADHREVMRLARPILVVLLLLLALAPAASAHGEAEPNHRDTPADLAAADIGRSLAVAHLARTLAPDLPQYLPTTWCGTKRYHRRHRPRRLPGDAASDQGRLRLRAGPARRFDTLEGLAADRRLAHRAVPGRCRRAAGVRCASTWAPNAARSTSTSRPCACPRARAYVSGDDDRRTSTPSQRRARRCGPRRTARRVRAGRRPHRPTHRRHDGIGEVAELSATTRPAPATTPTAAA